MRLFKDRSDAGRMLAKELSKYAERDDVIVLGLPRGGVPVGFEVAKALNAPLDVFIVRKLGLPGHEELAMGAVASGGVRVFNDDVVEFYEVSGESIEAVVEREQQELKRREKVYRGDRPMPDLLSRTILLVDDGLATGTTMRAAITALRSYEPERIVVAVPTGPLSTCKELEEIVDEVVCVATPELFEAVGAFYEDFTQTTDEEVRGLLDRAAVKVTA